MAIIPESFMNAVVALGVDTSENKKHWIGTGFIVARKDLNLPSFSTYYIVTNKHVIQGQSKIYVRFNSFGESFIKDYPINLYDDKGNPMYSSHPNVGSDILTFQIRPETLLNDKSIWGAFDLEDHALTLEQMKETGVEEGSLVYALGFPMNLVENIKTPICRLGCISRIMDAFILKQGTPLFLVDAQTFPGNSGGPIVSRPEHISITGTPVNSNANLIGILSAYLPYRDTLISQQTGEARMIQTENSGLTIVHPVDRIKEVVELEWQRLNPPAHLMQEQETVGKKQTAEVTA